MIRFILALAIVAGVVPAFADERPSNLRRDYERVNPPPGPRNEYVLDHIIPRANGGTDAWPNLQWQTKPDAKAKDLTECNGHKCGARQ